MKKNYTKQLIGDGISLNFNLNKDNFVKDIKFRKAIKCAVDKEEIKKELGEVFKETYGYLPNSSLNSTNRSYNIKSAEELLKDSKYNGEVVKIVYANNEDNNKKVINSIEKNFKKSKSKCRYSGIL
nr:ABC transporter substrate-binding protein [Clostridium novyi]